jgi:signal transduction histidine kinase
LKNIMTIIDSSAQFCLADVSQETSLHENISIILEKTRLATEIMEKFRDYRKTLAWHYHPVEVGKLILDTWRLMQHTFPAGRISFQADIEDHLPRVLGNHENLQRVFFNLFLNAIQAIGKKGKISVEVRLTASQEMVEIKITDNGAGIPPEIIGQIFLPYFTTKKEGDGLGLHICNLILREHKGTIDIESAEKSGTRVTVRIPAMKNDSQRKSVEELFGQGE